MEVKDIVEQYLKANGYDGLYNPVGECGCEIGDLAPCCEHQMHCEAAHKVPCTGAECDWGGDCKWHMVPGKRDQQEGEE